MGVPPPPGVGRPSKLVNSGRYRWYGERMEIFIEVVLINNSYGILDTNHSCYLVNETDFVNQQICQLKHDATLAIL